MASGDEDSPPEPAIAVHTIPVTTWMIVIEPKPANINLFFPLSAYILKISGSQIALGIGGCILPEH